MAWIGLDWIGCQGTGKTVCLISLITSYQFAHPEVGKLIYCTRTVPEMMKCIEELKRVIGYRRKQLGAEGDKVSYVRCRTIVKSTLPRMLVAVLREGKHLNGRDSVLTQRSRSAQL